MGDVMTGFKYFAEFATLAFFVLLAIVGIIEAWEIVIAFLARMP
jgi:hypothetical protein